MKQYFTAKSDLIFQQALCLEKDKELLSWFIGKLFNEEVTDLKIITPVLPISNKIEKRKTVDLLVTFKNRIVNIEVNSCHYKYLNNRNFGYSASLYESQLKKGVKITNKDEVIQINFTWGLPKKFENYGKLVYQMSEVGNPDLEDIYVDNFKIIVYNMDYFRKVYYNEVAGEFRKDAPKHLLMLDFGGKELEKLCKGDAMMEKFRDNVERLNDDKTVVHFLSEEQENELIKQSYYEDGMEYGEKLGEAKGKKEEKLDLAKKMLEKGIKLKEVQEITGLSFETLENLLRN